MRLQKESLWTTTVFFFVFFQVSGNSYLKVVSFSKLVPCLSTRFWIVGLLIKVVWSELSSGRNQGNYHVVDSRIFSPKFPVLGWAEIWKNKNLVEMYKKCMICMCNSDF